MQTRPHHARPRRLSLLLLALLGAVPVVAAAQENQETHPATAAEHHEFHRNHIGVFLGGSTLKEKNGFTLGGDYERRFHKHIGAGLQAEHAFGSVKDTVVVFPVFFHPGLTGLRIATGPGFSREDEEEHGEPEGVSTITKTVTEFLWRVQILYDFEATKRVTITPNLAIDFVNGRQFFVYGVTVGTGF